MIVTKMTDQIGKVQRVSKTVVKIIGMILTLREGTICNTMKKQREQQA
jgi:hypothetical protein